MTLPIKLESSNNQLKLQLNLLQEELNQIEFKTKEFESVLRSHLIEEIIEEQELTVLYKQQKAAKKLKRQAQKKHFNKVAITPLKQNQEKTAPKLREEKGLRKQLYRETMLQVHPDKFSLHEDKQDLASEITIKLVEIYSRGSLEELKAFHEHIFTGNAMHNIGSAEVIEDNHLAQEIEKMHGLIDKANKKYTYKVLNEYENPMRFLEELKAYYKDRLFKLRKRTRSKMS